MNLLNNIKRIKKLSIKRLVLLLFVVFVIIPVIILSIAYSFEYTKQIKASYYEINKYYLNQINIEVERRFDRLTSLLRYLSNNEIQVLFNDLSNEKRPSELRTIHKKINKIVATTLLNEESIFSFAFVGDNAFYSNNIISLNADISLDNLPKFSNEFFWVDEKFISKRFKYYGTKHIIGVAKKVNDPIRLRTIGYVIIFFEKEYLSSFETNEFEEFYILNHNIVLTNSDKNRGVFYRDLRHSENRNEFEVTDQSSNPKEIVLYSNKNLYGFTSVKVINTKNANLNAYKKLVPIIQIMSVCFCILLIYIFIIIKRVVKPIEKVSQYSNVEFENISDDLFYKSFNEISIIRQNIRSLCSENINLNTELVSEKKEKQIQIIQKMQARINPHFLYNTLNSIKIIANKYDNSNVSKMITALIKLLKSSVSKEGIFVTIEDEIKTLEQYIILESEIYCHNFKTIKNIDENLLKYDIPSFTLQPIVENAIFHALDNEQEDAQIIVSLYDDNGDICITVQDNGCGIPKEIIEQVLSGYSSTHRYGMTGIGLFETNVRIKLLYGDKYGINILSEIGKGTTVIIKIPKRTGENLIDGG